MSMLTRVADRVLSRLAPEMTASAACRRFTLYCYCSGGLAYRRICDDCGTYVYCSACTPSGTC